MSWEIEPHESIEERIAVGGAGELTGPERTYHAVWWLLFVAYGPGLLTYFNETDRAQIDTALDGLALIGADSFRSELTTALELLPDDYFERTISARNADIPEALEDAIYDRQRTFTDLPYPEDALAEFVARHDAEFVGPRTKLELWHSMHRRGADTAPRFVAKKFNREQEAEKDRAYSSRSCPHCDYPSPDYRPACKACGYPHGVA
jgi:hypothetical protein